MKLYVTIIVLSLIVLAITFSTVMPIESSFNEQDNFVVIIDGNDNFNDNVVLMPFEEINK